MSLDRKSEHNIVSKHDINIRNNVDEYELDLNMLEDMCSNLEEEVVLIDKTNQIVWVNEIIRKKGISQSVVQNFVVGKPHQVIFGKEAILEDFPALRECFSTGKLAKAEKTINSKTYKLIYFPIKFNEATEYVLEIIEKIDASKINANEYKTELNKNEKINKDDKIKISFKDVIKDAKLMNDMVKIVKPNLTNDIIKTLRPKIEKEHHEKYAPFIRVFLNSIKEPCLLVDSSKTLIMPNHSFSRKYSLSYLTKLSKPKKSKSKNSSSSKKFNLFLKKSSSKHPLKLYSKLLGNIYYFEDVKKQK